MIKVINGNILNASENIICQQVNCKKVMGSGLAKQIRTKYPEVYQSYKKFCESEKELLGEVNSVVVQDKATNRTYIILNIFGQDGYGRDKQYTDYNALKRAFKRIYDNLNISGMPFYGMSIAIPYNFGCGLAGGNWNIVYKIIEEIFQDYDVTIYKFQ